MKLIITENQYNTLTELRSHPDTNVDEFFDNFINRMLKKLLLNELKQVVK